MRIVFFSITLIFSTFFINACERQEKTPEQLFEEREYQAAFEAFLPLAKEGDAEAQHYIGLIYYLGLIKRRDLSKAEQWFKAAAVQKHASAQLNYAMILEQRAKQDIDFLEAYKWYYAAYENGHPGAEKRIRHLLDIHRIFHNQRVYAQKDMEPYIDYTRKQNTN